eukprot:1141292-Pelagomonas_calceolata.AAC.1
MRLLLSCVFLALCNLDYDSLRLTHVINRSLCSLVSRCACSSWVFCLDAHAHPGCSRGFAINRALVLCYQPCLGALPWCFAICRA